MAPVRHGAYETSAAPAHTIGQHVRCGFFLDAARTPARLGDPLPPAENMPAPGHLTATLGATALDLREPAPTTDHRTTCTDTSCGATRTARPRLRISRSGVGVSSDSPRWNAIGPRNRQQNGQRRRPHRPGKAKRTSALTYEACTGQHPKTPVGSPRPRSGRRGSRIKSGPDHQAAAQRPSPEGLPSSPAPTSKLRVSERSANTGQLRPAAAKHRSNCYRGGGIHRGGEPSRSGEAQVTHEP